MAINQTVLQGQGVGQQVGGVSQATYQQVQDSIARQQQTNGGGGGGYTAPGKPAWAVVGQDYESLAWLILGLM
ncbi:MAG TPA: hypothetical protein EYN66_04570 [Myxococcales bacterium]|nr:hypothetical protein [Myxococcales bacterium]